MRRHLFLVIAFTLFCFGAGIAQEASNVQTFTPSKLLGNGQWDIKSFWSVYTQTEQTNERSRRNDIERQTFLTITNEFFTGVSKNSRVNLGVTFQVRSSQIGGDNLYDALGVFRFEDDETSAKASLTSVAPAIRIQPFKNIGNFSLTSSFIIPIFEDTPGIFLDQRSFAWETKFFFDHTFGGNKWQLFTEVDTKLNFGEDREDVSPTDNSGERFAGDSLFLPLSAFLSYFPSAKSTIFINAQQTFLIGIDNPQFNGGDNFSQNGTALGFGGKYQLTSKLNIEASYSNIVRGNNFQGLGETYSIGLRVIL